MDEMLRKALYLLKLLDSSDSISHAKDAYFFDADEVDVNAYVALLNAPELIAEIEGYLNGLDDTYPCALCGEIINKSQAKDHMLRVHRMEVK